MKHKHTPIDSLGIKYCSECRLVLGAADKKECDCHSIKQGLKEIEHGEFIDKSKVFNLIESQIRAEKEDY